MRSLVLCMLLACDVAPEEDSLVDSADTGASEEAASGGGSAAPMITVCHHYTNIYDGSTLVGDLRESAYWSSCSSGTKVGPYNDGDAFVCVYNASYLSKITSGDWSGLTTSCAGSSAVAADLTSMGCVSPPSDLYLWWMLDETSGTSVADAYELGMTGTLYNGPTSASGKVNTSRRFDGRDDYLSVPDDPMLDMATSDWSFAAWIRVPSGSSLSGVKVIADKRQSSIVGYHIYLTGGALGIQLADSTGYTNYTASTSKLTADDQWHHVAVTVDRGASSGLVFYIDGAKVSATTPGRNGTLDNTSPLTIGVRSAAMGGGGYFPGYIDEVMLIDRVLTATEISDLYGAGGFGFCRP